MKVLCFFGLLAWVVLALSAPAPKAQLAPKVQLVEYISITECLRFLTDVANNIKEIYNEIKVKVESGVLEGENEVFLKHIKGLLVQLLLKIKTKLAKVTDDLIGYKVSDDPLDDVSKSAVVEGIENLVASKRERLGNIVERLVPGEEYEALANIMEIVRHIKAVFDQLRATMASGEIEADILVFLESLKSAVTAKIAEAKPTVKAALEKFRDAIEQIAAVAKANTEAGVEQGKLVLVQLLEKIMSKLTES